MTKRYNGMNLKDAVALARRLGFEVREKPRTGELLINHETMPHPVRISYHGRKDAPRCLTVAFQRIDRAKRR